MLALNCRLYGDTAFSDVSFTVCNSEFQAHTVVLRARAPNFCWHFLPRQSSPVSVQTCIQINGLEATEFETFLRYYNIILQQGPNLHFPGRQCN